MSETAAIKALEKARADRQAAEKWYQLLQDRDSQDGRPFRLSLIRSKVTMMICGQHFAGGQNYHESPPALNNKLAEIVCLAPDNIKQAIDLLITDELATAKAAQESLEAALAIIQRAGASGI